MIYIQCHENYDDIKRKIRNLKKLEMKISYPSTYNYEYNKNDYKNSQKNYKQSKSIKLVWDDFFCSQEECSKNVKYPIKKLALMNKEEIKDVINEYFYYVYYKMYKENGLENMQTYDAEILTQMGLPFHADFSEVKKKFRELAKQYHPDTGGDSTKFIDLIENYKKLNK